MENLTSDQAKVRNSCWSNIQSLLNLEFQARIKNEGLKSTPKLPDINNKILGSNDQALADNQPEVGDVTKVSKIQTEIQMLIAMMEREQVEKEMANVLKTWFLAWQYTDEGFADKEEFETKLKMMNLLISTKLLKALFKFIVSKKDKGMVSFAKIKQLAEELKVTANKLKDQYHAKDLMYGKITTKENDLDHPLINLIEIKMEEKFKTIHDAFRIFDTNGDSKLDFKEFEKGMNHLAADLSKEDIIQAYNLLDRNKNGEIEYHEFCDSFDGYKRRGNPLVTSQQTKDIWAGVMKLHDLDKKTHKDTSVKYSPPIFGIANSGVSNSLTNRLNKMRNSESIHGFGSRTSRVLDLGQDDQIERYSTMEDILSQASAIRSKMQIPIPKNKNPELFIKDVSESGRSVKGGSKGRNKNMQASLTYGFSKNEHSNMDELINHDYMNSFI